MYFGFLGVLLYVVGWESLRFTVYFLYFTTRLCVFLNGIHALSGLSFIPHVFPSVIS